MRWDIGHKWFRYDPNKIPGIRAEMRRMAEIRENIRNNNNNNIIRRNNRNNNMNNNMNNIRDEIKESKQDKYNNI
ncbi:MAG: hypothetical protein GY938_20495, partial [Ketobacter sp.]|nr:hypothetical protein [Ketobacter sp.]